MEQLIMDSQGLIHYILKPYRSNPRLEYEDLVQVAEEALIQAAQRFDPETHPGVKFSTFACAYIKGRVLTYVRKEQRIMNSELSLDSSTDSENERDGTFVDLIESTSARDCMEEVEAQVLLNNLHKVLTPNEFEAWRAAYLRNETQAELANRLGLSQARVCHLQQSARLKIQRLLQ